jgi:hypothetical protein
MRVGGSGGVGHEFVVSEEDDGEFKRKGDEFDIGVL